MPKPANYSDEEILTALILTIPKKLTKGQIGRVLGIKSAGQKHWRERFQKLGDKGLLSIHSLAAGELFNGSPILTYYLTAANLEAVWRHYFINYDERHGLVNDPFLTPFSAGIWNVTSSPEFSELVGSKFNYLFLSGRNDSNPAKLADRIKPLSKTKVWKVMDALLSIGWKTEAYRRKPVLMETLNAEQKKTYDLITIVYEKKIREHPAEYKKFMALFEKNFKYYI